MWQKRGRKKAWSKLPGRSARIYIDKRTAPIDFLHFRIYLHPVLPTPLGGARFILPTLRCYGLAKCLPRDVKFFLASNGNGELVVHHRVHFTLTQEVRFDLAKTCSSRDSPHLPHKAALSAPHIKLSRPLFQRSEIWYTKLLPEQGPGTVTIVAPLQIHQSLLFLPAPLFHRLASPEHDLGNNMPCFKATMSR